MAIIVLPFGEDCLVPVGFELVHCVYGNRILFVLREGFVLSNEILKGALLIFRKLDDLAVVKSVGIDGDDSASRRDLQILYRKSFLTPRTGLGDC